MHRDRYQQGFTLVELFITMFIVALLLMLGVPSYRDAIANSNLRSATIDLITALNTAHAQAVSLRNSISVEATDGADWSNGWQIDYPVSAVPGVDIEQDQTFGGYPGVTVTPAGGEMALSFNNRGMVAPTSTFDICDGRAGETGRRVAVSISGRVTSENLVCP